MTDKTFSLQPGHKRTVQRGPKPATGWINDGTTTLQAEDSASFPALATPPPDPDPPPEPPPSGALRGFGRGVARSTQPVLTVNTLAGLRAAAGAGGRNIRVDVQMGMIYNLAGQDLVVKSGTTIDFGNLICMGAALKIAGVSDVFIENARFYAGDQYGNATDLDSLNVNGNQSPVRRIYIRNSQFMWGPDVNASFLGDVQDVTCERVMFAEGLYNSAHAESPHSLGPNVASEDPTRPAKSVSFIECVVSTCQSRNFRLIGVAQVELVGCTIYNYNEGPQGCPASANLLGCTWKKGPIALANNLLFRAQDGGHGAFTAKADTVYVGQKQVIGFSDSGVDPRVKSTSLRFQSTEPEPDPVVAHTTALETAGAVPADKQLSRVRANIRNGTGTYVNGYGKPGSYTSLL